MIPRGTYATLTRVPILCSSNTSGDTGGLDGDVTFALAGPFSSKIAI